MEILAYIVNWKPLITDKRGRDTSKWAEAILAERLDRLSTAVTSGWAAVDELGSENLPPELSDKVANLQRPLYIFAAPEHLFRKKANWLDKTTTWDEHFYTPEEKQVYIRTLQALSKPRSCGDVLVAAGTFLWAAPRTTAQPLVDELKTKYTERIKTKWAANPPAHATERLWRD